MLATAGQQRQGEHDERQDIGFGRRLFTAGDTHGLDHQRSRPRIPLRGSRRKKELHPLLAVGIVVELRLRLGVTLQEGDGPSYPNKFSGEFLL